MTAGRKDINRPRGFRFRDRRSRTFFVAWSTRPHFQLVVADPFAWFSVGLFNLSFIVWRPRKRS